MLSLTVTDPCTPHLIELLHKLRNKPHCRVFGQLLTVEFSDYSTLYSSYNRIAPH